MDKTPISGSAEERPGPSDALDELPVAYVEMDVHGAITRANRATRQIYAAHCGALIGKPGWALMPAEEQELSRTAFRAAMESSGELPVARRFIYTSSGHFRVHALHRNVIRDAEGRAAGMRVVSVDVTDAHQAQEEARRSRQWLECVLASLAEAVIVTDSMGCIRTVNPAAEQLFGLKAGELLGKEIEEALPLLASQLGGDAPVSFTMALDKPMRKIVKLLDREGRQMPVEVSLAPITESESGCTAGMICLLHRTE